MRKWVQAILDSPNMPSRRPRVDANYESNVRGLFIVGDLSGASVVKLAMEQGAQVAGHIASRKDARGSDPGMYDVLVAGAGAAGLNAALVAQNLGLRTVVLEKNKIANTIQDFPEGKWVFAEPESVPPVGKPWPEGASKEDLLARWQQDIVDNRLEVKTGEGVTGIRKQKDGSFEVETPSATYRARRVILATGQRGNPRKLGVPGEDREQVYHRLYSPKHYQNEDILVVGGGNSAVEAALALAGPNRVTLSYRDGDFPRVFKDNQRKLKAAVEAGHVRVLLHSEVERFDDGYCAIRLKGESERVRYDHAFVLIGADTPTEFLHSLGIKLENEWTGSLILTIFLVVITLIGLWLYGGKPQVELGAILSVAGFGSLLLTAWRGSRFSLLGISFLICYTIYGAKQAPGYEFWPFKGWGANSLTFFDRPWSFWYTVLYTAVMTVFGVQAMKRWGFDRKDRFQIWRYTSLIGFQWIFFFLIPEYLFQVAVKYQWVGERLASDPNFANNAWRSYGIVYAWPLFFYTFLGNPHQIWSFWGVFLTFLLIPALVLFHGKRYCSWICGCGGLAETLGDRWRHLAPKGKTSIRWEEMNLWVLVAAVAVTAMLLTQNVVRIFQRPAAAGLEWYHLIADVWLVGILPVTLYPFFGGKVWCRYWCPLAKLMQIWSAAFTRFKVSRFAIHSNDKCIACGECSRNCQVGINVMNFAMKQEILNNYNSSCIGCGICVTVCPMDVLSFQPQLSKTDLVQIEAAKA